MPLNPNIRKVLNVEIVTVDLVTHEEEQNRTINFGNPHDRAWLEKHQFWAVYNNKGIAFNPIA